MSKRLPLLATIALVALGLVACGGPAPGGSDSAVAARAATPEPVASPSATQLPTSAPTPAACLPETGDEGDTCQIVIGTANIFGAGHDVPPAPGGGGGGTPPTTWSVPQGSSTMTVTSATGLVKPIDFLAAENGAAGDLIGPTDVTSFEGISGIVDSNNGMFLVGVFLTDQPPSGDGPERLDFSGQGNFHELAPEIGQTFLIGDGAGRTYIVPSDASRLYLGFADAYLYQGAPGWYGNNQGQLAVSVEFADGTEVSTPELTPDPSIVHLSAFANIFGAGHEAPPEPGAERGSVSTASLQDDLWGTEAPRGPRRKY